MTSSESPRTLRIDGNPSASDIAAVVTVLSALGNGVETEPTVTSPWVANARRGRFVPRPGPGAWRASLRSR